MQLYIQYYRLHVFLWSHDMNEGRTSWQEGEAIYFVSP